MKTKFAAMLVLTVCAAIPMFGQSTPSTFGQGINLKVSCGQKVGGTLPTVNAALKLLSPAMNNTITVSGTCNENVLIQGFDRLTLVSTTGATINDASAGQSSAVFIADSRRVTLQGLTINGSVDCAYASVCYLTANTIQSSVGQQGAAVWNGSQGFLTNNVIKNNSGRGLTVTGGAQVFSTTDTFESNADAGIVVNSESHFACSKSIVENNGGGGVVISDHSMGRFISCTISGNSGDGVAVQGVSEARFDSYSGAATVTANTVSGVLVGSLSFGFFTGGANITGNLSGTDVVCPGQFPVTRGALTQIGGGTTNCVEP